MSLYKANRALTDFRRKLFRFVHGSILSKIGASTKPGAVQNHQHAILLDRSYANTEHW